VKKLNILFVTTVTISNFLYAGGDILMPVIEQHEDVYVPVEPVEEEKEVVPVSPPIPKIDSVPIKPKPIKNVIPLGLYVGLGLTATRYEPNCGCAKTGNVDKTAGIIGRVGYDFNQFFGIEARGIRTNWKSEGGKLKHYGAFLKPMYPVSNDINIYGLAGVAKTKTAGGGRQLTDANGFAWGVGVEYDLDKEYAKEGRYSRDFDGYGNQESGWGLFVDYERLLQKSGSPDLDAISVGITYDF